MQQLMMEADVANRAAERDLPSGYFFQRFDGSNDAVTAWKTIMAEPPFLALEDSEECYRRMILEYPDCIPTEDIWFICNERGERVASITTITKKDGSGYVHMVKARASEQGKGLGHAMARYALRVFAERGVERVVLTTDDFRLPAVKTYLSAGFLPVIYEDPDSDMEKRWTDVLARLGLENTERVYH